MTMKQMLTDCLIVLLLGAVVHAQAAITGTWRGTTPSGTPLVLDLTATEAVLTGTLTRNDQTVTITDGTVSKDRFAFRATINDQTEGFTGELAGDEIKVWLDRQGPERAAVLKRVKN
jgi:hypothetical protein